VRKLIFHVGMPKTGSTSIQSTLFSNTPDKRFRLITLDSVFGNRCVVAAFATDDGAHHGFFSETVPKWYLPFLSRSSKNYLKRALRACAQSDLVPILSTEGAWGFQEIDLQSMKEFFESEGYQAEVFGYVRAPLDFYESVFQQIVKIGRQPNLHNNTHVSRHYSDRIASLQKVFGKDQVRLKVFDPKSFPQRCVVRDFCGWIGMDFGDANVIRENESINSEAIKLLYAWNRVHNKNVFGLYPRLKRRIVLEALQDLPGKPLRLHASLVKKFEAGLSTAVKEIRDENGRILPLTVVERESTYGIKTVDDFFDFNDETLQWLADRTKHQRVVQSDPSQRLQKVVDQLRYFSCWRFPGILGRLLWNEMRLRWERIWKKRRMQGRSEPAGCFAR